MNGQEIKILFIEDEENDYIWVRDMLSDIPSARFRLDWISNYEEAVAEICRFRHDVYLLDYRLGVRDGLELLREATEKGGSGPVILLTGQGDYGVDVEAMKIGAADYLVKNQINPDLLERSIRHAIERKRAEEQLRSLSSQLLTAQEDERRRVAGELHDSVAGSLGAIKVMIEKILGQRERDEQLQEGLRDLIAKVQQADEETRRIMSNLRPSVLDDLGIIAAINWFCREFQKTYPQVSIEQQIHVEENEIPDALRTPIFRILQEALNNVAKHSQATFVKPSLRRSDRRIELKVQDNGQGFDLEAQTPAETSGSGLGLINMRERAELTGGSFDIVSAEGKGTTIRASWPLAHFPQL